MNVSPRLRKPQDSTSRRSPGKARYSHSSVSTPVGSHTASAIDRAGTQARRRTAAARGGSGSSPRPGIRAAGELGQHADVLGVVEQEVKRRGELANLADDAGGDRLAHAVHLLVEREDEGLPQRPRCRAARDLRARARSPPASRTAASRRGRPCRPRGRRSSTRRASRSAGGCTRPRVRGVVQHLVVAVHRPVRHRARRPTRRRAPGRGWPPSRPRRRRPRGALAGTRSLVILRSRGCPNGPVRRSRSCADPTNGSS